MQLLMVEYVIQLSNKVTREQNRNKTELSELKKIKETDQASHGFKFLNMLLLERIEVGNST